MSKHTPGPWIVEPDEWTGRKSDLIVGNMNATPANRYIVCMLGDETDERNETDTANAALVAASPELQESLQELFNWMREHTGPRDGTHDMLVKAHTALTKSGYIL